MTDIPLRDQPSRYEIAHVLESAARRPSYSPLGFYVQAADALLERFDISLRSPHPTPEKQ